MVGLIIRSFISVFTSLLFCGGLIYPSLGWAKIHIEPYVGLSGTYTGSKPVKKDTFEDHSLAVDYLSEGRYYGGMNMGMRVGYSSLGLAVGLDFTVGRWTSLYKENFVSFRNREIMTPILPGLFVSYKLPMLFRAYASLIPHAFVHFTSQDGESRYCNQVRGAKFGLSYLSLPFLSVNFEYLPMHIGGQNCNSWSHTGAVYANFTF